ncbi:uncharacterized protein [Clytia hemisphaerica]|uniref:uncharacterized protein n=1 Tax=Clytia hemisphaerica TaxID=252671 RepID=UPI0034D489A2
MLMFCSTNICSIWADIVFTPEKSSKQESATYPLEEGWNTGNVHKKRKVIRDIVVWDSGLGDAFKWDKERTPFWWPSNLTFGNMKSVNVASCDRILDAYRKMLIKSRINQITEMPNQPWLELKKWADTTVEEVDLVVDWVKCDWQEPTINKRFVSRRFRSVTSDWIASSEREPFWWLNLTKSLSFAVFATSKEEKFIKNLALAACIKDFSALLNFVREGTDSIDASQIKTWLNVDGDFNTEAYIVKDHLMNISSASEMYYLFGCVLAFDLTINIIDMEGIENKIAKKTSHPSSTTITILKSESGYCSLMKIKEPINNGPCGENPYCWASPISSHAVMKCKHCRLTLTYHKFCVAWNEEFCGCDNLVPLAQSVKTKILDPDTFDKYLDIGVDFLGDFVKQLANGMFRTFRGNLATKLFEKEEAEWWNGFFKNVMPANSYNKAVEFVKNSITNESRKELMKRFPEDKIEKLIEEWLMPDVVIKICQTLAATNGIRNVSEMTISNILFYLEYDL